MLNTNITYCDDQLKVNNEWSKTKNNRQNLVYDMIRLFYPVSKIECFKSELTQLFIIDKRMEIFNRDHYKVEIRYSNSNDWIECVLSELFRRLYEISIELLPQCIFEDGERFNSEDELKKYQEEKRKKDQFKMKCLNEWNLYKKEYIVIYTSFENFYESELRTQKA